MTSRVIALANAVVVVDDFERPQALIADPQRLGGKFRPAQMALQPRHERHASPSRCDSHCSHRARDPLSCDTRPGADRFDRRGPLPVVNAAMDGPAPLRQNPITSGCRTASSRRNPGTSRCAIWLMRAVPQRLAKILGACPICSAPSSSATMLHVEDRVARAAALRGKRAARHRGRQLDVRRRDDDAPPRRPRPLRHVQSTRPRARSNSSRRRRAPAPRCRDAPRSSTPAARISSPARAAVDQFPQPQSRDRRRGAAAESAAQRNLAADLDVRARRPTPFAAGSASNARSIRLGPPSGPSQKPALEPAAPVVDRLA